MPRHIKPRNGNGDGRGLWGSIRALLEPETPAEMGGLLGASILPGIGEAIDVADFAAGLQDHDFGRMGWATAGLLLPFVAGSTLRKVGQQIGKKVGRGAKAADERVVFREADSDIGAEGMEGLNRPGRAYRGMEAAEYDATVGSGGGATSRQDYSVADEGTSYADDIRDAESYVNFGRSDPRITGRPSYIVEVDATDLTRSPDGYLKASGEVPPERIERVWKITDEDGALVGRKGAKAADELPMDEASRMARAESEGFDTGTTFYHGTKADIDEFNPNPSDAYDSGWLGRGTYITTNPGTASAYSGLKAGTGGERVMPLYARLNDMKILDVDPSAKIVGQRIEMEEGREAARRWAQDQTDELRAQGYDGVRVTYRAGDVGSSAGEELVVFDPKNLRSRSARFDPSKFESASLIAGGAGLLGAGMARQRERR
jgi:hypothetical protein